MELLDSNRDESGVSSVISTILMVAVTVILAAVVSVFALGLADSADSETPQADFSFEYDVDGSTVTVTHESGDTVDGDRVRFAGAAQSGTELGGVTEWKGRSVSGGDSATVPVAAGEELRVVWAERGGESSATLAASQTPEELGASALVATVDAESANSDYTFDVTMAYLTNVEGDSVYVVVEETGGFYQPDADGTITKSEAGTAVSFSLTDRNGDENGIGENNPIRVTVYETSARTTVLDRVDTLS